MALYEPQPLPDELPASYAARVGEWYTSWNKLDKTLGQFFTPLPIARYMASLFPAAKHSLRLLDPSAGIGILACAVCEATTGDIALEAFEIDEQLADYLEVCLRYAARWMQMQGRNFRFSVQRCDFILHYADCLHTIPHHAFDAVICNPPYFKVAKTDLRAQVTASIVHGQPNMYALFMAVSAALVRHEGYAVYITPRSYTSGGYFSRFRQYFFEQMRPRALHLFESRRSVFDKVLQESLIMLAQRSLEDDDVLLSSSDDFEFAHVIKRSKPLAQILDEHHTLHLPLSDEDDAVRSLVDSWHGRLDDYGLAVSTGPVVAFRATSHVSGQGQVPAQHVPLFWLQNIKSMSCVWPVKQHQQYLAIAGAEALLLPNKCYVFVRRFSAKEEHRRLTAAPYLGSIDTPFVSAENHLNYIYRIEGDLSEDETVGLAVLLNSKLMDSYFRIFNGNTQVSATELRNLPLPPLTTIVEMGQRFAQGERDIDVLVHDVVGMYA
jgi:adenine-specific DNA-methyltransferase